MNYEDILEVVLARANGAKEKYHEFDSVGHGASKLREEYAETVVELERYFNTPDSSSERGALLERIYQEAVDVAVVSLRLAWLARSLNQPTPKLSEVILGGTE